VVNAHSNEPIETILSGVLSPARHRRTSIHRRFPRGPATKPAPTVAKNWDPGRGDDWQPVAQQQVNHRDAPTRADKTPKNPERRTRSSAIVRTPSDKSNAPNAVSHFL